MNLKTKIVQFCCLLMLALTVFAAARAEIDEPVSVHDDKFVTVQVFNDSLAINDSEGMLLNTSLTVSYHLLTIEDVDEVLNVSVQNCNVSGIVERVIAFENLTNVISQSETDSRTALLNALQQQVVAPLKDDVQYRQEQFDLMNKLTACEVNKTEIKGSMQAMGMEVARLDNQLRDCQSLNKWIILFSCVLFATCVFLVVTIYRHGRPPLVG